ncbi:hypothetical protein MUP77_02250 [Candidatus Bathyarchaeota archaeon]|nr:hypothetical protein [Candidatus Bathyarchaeota archaeon]
MSKYLITKGREIIKTSTLYSDDKTQVPKRVIEELRLERGSQIVWVKEAGRIYVEPSKTV